MMRKEIVLLIMSFQVHEYTISTKNITEIVKETNHFVTNK